VRTLIPALDHLAGAFTAKAQEFATVVKSGRTHLMDATPVTLGQEFGGYAASMQYGHRAADLGAAADRRAAAGGTAGIRQEWCSPAPALRQRARSTPANASAVFWHVAITATLQHGRSNPTAILFQLLEFVGVIPFS